VTDKLSADDTAEFLMRLHMPDSEYEKIKKQTDRLSRKPRATSQTSDGVLARASSRDTFKKETEPERSHRIQYMMLLGLVRFTHGQLQEEIVGAIEYMKKEGKKANWKDLMERVYSPVTLS